MGVGDAMNIQKPRGDQRTRARPGCGWALAEQRDIETALLLRLAQRGLLRIFIELDVPAQRQPGVQLAMVNQQNLSAVNDKDGDRKINFLVNVSHGDLKRKM